VAGSCTGCRLRTLLLHCGHSMHITVLSDQIAMYCDHSLAQFCSVLLSPAQPCSVIPVTPNGGSKSCWICCHNNAIATCTADAVRHGAPMCKVWAWLQARVLCFHARALHTSYAGSWVCGSLPSSYVQLPATSLLLPNSCFQTHWVT
jgi:hypothetical protein